MASDDRDLSVARAAALSAGEILMAHYSGGYPPTHAKSRPSDVVSSADLEAEHSILSALQDAFPADGILSEEGTHRPTSSGRTWIVDPLDGTANFVRKIPVWAISIACAVASEVALGLVYDPLREEMYYAGADGVLGMTSCSFRAGRSYSLATAMVAGYDEQAHRLPLATQQQRVGQSRDFGSAALSLAWTAVGRCDATHYRTRDLKEWDVAAGLFLCKSAGLRTFTSVQADGMRQVAAGPQQLLDLLVGE